MKSFPFKPKEDATTRIEGKELVIKEVGYRGR
jgi:hypothetical protein